jgi:hypothetical protein
MDFVVASGHGCGAYNASGSNVTDIPNWKNNLQTIELEQEQNHKNHQTGLRWSWARTQMEIPSSH